jgi:hypothetical protein
MTTYKEILTEGIIDEQWGFGRKRITVTTQDSIAKCPYSFTGLGYKNQDGKLFLGLRMNVDQHSPLNLKEWTEGMNVERVWGFMVTELMAEFVKTNKTFQKV